MNALKIVIFIVLLGFGSLRANDDIFRSIVAHSSQLSSIQQKEFLQVKDNLMRFILLGIGQDQKTKLELIAQMREYLELEASKLGPNLEFNRKLIYVDSWDLKSDVRFLRAQILSEKASIAPISFDQTQLLALTRRMGDDQLSMIIDSLFSLESSDEQRLQIYGNIERYYQEQVGMIRNLGDKLIQSPDFHLSSPAQEVFVKNFLNFYFQNLDEESLKNIVLDLVTQSSKPTTDETIGIVLRNSGPGLGKLLQQLGKDPELGESLARIIDVLESSNKAVPHYLFNDIVKNDQAGALIEKIEEKPLGTGTMAQVNKGLFRSESELKAVAVRVLKPGIKARAQSDIEILRKFLRPGQHLDDISPAMIESLQKLIDPLEGFLMAELDIALTKDKQLKAIEVYGRVVEVAVGKERIQVEIHVPRLLDQTPESQIMIQEYIDAATKFNQLENTASQRAISRALNQMWFNEAILESGFIHADLHQGNFSVEQISPTRYRINLFDLGMAETLDRDLRRAFVLIGTGVKFENAKLITRGFALLNPDMNYDLLKNAVVAEMTEKSLTSEEWILWGMRRNLIVSDQLGSLARGSNLVFQLSRSMGQEEAHITSKSLIKNFIYSVTKKLFSPTQSSTLSSGDLWAIGSSASSKSCSDLLNSLRRRAP
jgi:ubiquinone biosynthesis protein